MRITQWGEYGIHCAIIIAQEEQNASGPVGAEHIAKSLNIDLQYAQQILQRLRRNSIIKSVRGPHGGYCLAREADSISLLDIIRAAEGNTLEIICDTKPINLERCNNGHACCLRDVWHGLRKEIDSYLEEYSLAGLAGQNQTMGKIVTLGRQVN